MKSWKAASLIFLFAWDGQTIHGPPGLGPHQKRDTKKPSLLK